MDPDQQVARLEKLIVRLGGFPDRDLIHQITECGRLGLRTGGQALAERMCAAIMDVLDDGENGATAAERRVPLFYALDSVVKNVGDVFQPLLSVRVRAAFGRAFAACAEKDKTQANDSKLIMQLSKKLETLLMENEDLRDNNDRLNQRLVQVECEYVALPSGVPLK